MREDQNTPELIVVIENDDLDRRSVVQSKVLRLGQFDRPLLKWTYPFTRRSDFSKVDGYVKIIKLYIFKNIMGHLINFVLRFMTI